MQGDVRARRRRFGDTLNRRMPDECDDETDTARVAAEQPAELALDDTADVTALADLVRAKTPRATTDPGWPPPPPEKASEPTRHARMFGAETPETFAVRFPKRT